MSYANYIFCKRGVFTQTKCRNRRNKLRQIERRQFQNISSEEASPPFNGYPQLLVMSKWYVRHFTYTQTSLTYHKRGFSDNRFPRIGSPGLSSPQRWPSCTLFAVLSLGTHYLEAAVNPLFPFFPTLFSRYFSNFFASLVSHFYVMASLASRGYAKNTILFQQEITYFSRYPHLYVQYLETLGPSLI